MPPQSRASHGHTGNGLAGQRRPECMRSIFDARAIIRFSLRHHQKASPSNSHGGPYRSGETSSRTAHDPMAFRMNPWKAAGADSQQPFSAAAYSIRSPSQKLTIQCLPCHLPRLHSFVSSVQNDGIGSGGAVPPYHINLPRGLRITRSANLLQVFLGTMIAP